MSSRYKRLNQRQDDVKNGGVLKVARLIMQVENCNEEIGNNLWIKKMIKKIKKGNRRQKKKKKHNEWNLTDRTYIILASLTEVSPVDSREDYRTPPVIIHLDWLSNKAEWPRLP